MYPLVASDDPPVGYQNTPQNNPQEIREQADPAVWDILVPRWATSVPPPQKNKLTAWGKIPLEETIAFKAWGPEGIPAAA